MPKTFLCSYLVIGQSLVGFIFKLSQQNIIGMSHNDTKYYDCILNNLATFKWIKFLENLHEVSKDTIDKTRMKVMSMHLVLLINSPEQEQELLGRLVNKLGDPVRSVAAKG